MTDITTKPPEQTGLALAETAKTPTQPPAPTPAPAANLSPAAASVFAQLPIPEEPCKVLQTILSWPRPHNSSSEKLFYGWLKARLKSKAPAGATIKQFENAENIVAVTIPREDGTDSDVLFSCHVDTVDSGEYKQGDRKSLCYDAHFGTIFLAKESKGTCLGADDGAGVWLMLKMIEANKPGTYIFHRGEERGGISAKAMAQNYKDWLKKFEVAVAFDRPRCDEVITHQGGEECASSKFALALSAALNLNQPAFNYKPSSRGVYTDTKEYRRIIHECINLGVGYDRQHGIGEEQDYAHLEALLAAVLAVDWDTLPVDRDATKTPAYTNYSGGYTGYGGYNRHGYGRQATINDYDLPDEENVPFGGGGKRTGKAKGNPPRASAHVPSEYSAEDLIFDACHMTVEELMIFIDEHQDDAAMTMIALVREVQKLRADVKQLDTFLGMR